MATNDRYWFSATPFGYGWWRPSHWLGWCSLLIAIALVFLAGNSFPPAEAPLYFWGAVVAIAAGFLLICKIKGEPLGRGRA
ncbi:hypothetical protein [Rheinheimera sp.]|uniref:hypothetical protein n=1 Tax=Rheinheimera sp. TaxID=1869214 RepID=UPI00307ECF4B